MLVCNRQLLCAYTLAVGVRDSWTEVFLVRQEAYFLQYLSFEVSQSLIPHPEPKSLLIQQMNRYPEHALCL